MICIYPPWFLCFWQKGGENLFDVFYFEPFVDEWQKGGEVFELYACFHCLRGRSICLFLVNYAYIFVLQKGEKDFDLCLLHVFISILAYIFMCLIAISIISCYAWVKGELLWSFTLIHAYITSWVLSSSKRRRLLARKPITLVLIMINSCSYNTNDLVFT